MKKQKQNKLWINLKFDLANHTIFSRELLRKYVDMFWRKTMDKLNDESHILLLLRLIYVNDQVSTLTPLQKLNKNDKLYFINHIMDTFVFKTESESSNPIIPIKSVIFSYGIRKGKVEDKTKDKFINENVSIKSYYNHKLPITFNPLDFGELMFKSDNHYVINYNNNNLINIKQMITNDENKYNLVEFYKNNKLLFTWKDTFINENSFIRELGSRVYNFERLNKDTHYELTLVQKIKKTRFIRNLKKGDGPLDNKFIIMDLETFAQNIDDKSNKLTPYLLCWFDGSNEIAHFTAEYFSF
jgi:hypothetical protein